MTPRRKSAKAVTTRPVDLERRWAVALAEAGTKEKYWAEAEGLSQQHVGEVVRGTRTSAPLLARILRFIEQQERRLVQRIPAA